MTPEVKWQPISATTDTEWFEEEAKKVIASNRSPLPEQSSKFGDAVVEWEELDPGVAAVHAFGTLNDKVLGRQIVVSALINNNYAIAEFTFDGENADGIQKFADWTDIESKAKRLIQSGNVTILRNGEQNIVSHVVGDHGEYDCEIGRDDPDSRAITTWQCDCPWSQFSWGRTRQWKKYEGRPCAHVLATFWKSQATPIDDGGLGAQMPGDGGPQLPPTPSAPTTIPPTMPGAPTPQDKGILPPSPTEQLQMMQAPAQPGTTPAGLPAPPGTPSVPGARQPTPFNPVQLPSTYSKWNPKVGDEVEVIQGPEHVRGKRGTIAEIEPEMKGGLPTVWPMVDLGESELYRMLPNDLKLVTTSAWEFKEAAATYENGDMVRLEVEEYGVMEGKSVEHGAGQYKLIPKNSIGEVLGVDPTTGWADVIFPIHDAGPLEPFHVRVFLEPAQLTPMPNIKKPGPFIKRRT